MAANTETIALTGLAAEALPFGETGEHRGIEPVRLAQPWLAVAQVATAVYAGLAIWFVVSFYQGPGIQLVVNTPFFPDEAVFREGLRQLHVSVGVFTTLYFGAIYVFVASFLAAAAIVVYRRPNEITAYLVALFLISVACATPPGQVEELAADRPLLLHIGTILSVTFPVLFLALMFLFPTGRFAPRWLLWVFAGLFASIVLIQVFSPRYVAGGSATTSVLIQLSLFLVAAGSQIYRYRYHSTAVERQQLKWAVFGLVTALALFTSANAMMVATGSDQPGAPAVRATLVTFGFLIVPTLGLLGAAVCLVHAVLRRNLFGVDTVISRSAVYLVLSLLIVAIYAAIVGLAVTLPGSRGDGFAGFFAAVIVALVFQPARTRLQRAANHLIFGDADEPYAVLSNLNRRLDSALDPAEVPQAIVATVVTALRAPYARLNLREGMPGAIEVTAGTPSPAALSVPITYQGESLGELQVASRPGNDYRKADLRLLEDLARQAGPALHSLSARDDLRTSRERIVLAREEERRRLRRDLHDGLGPRLAALALRIDSVGDRVEGDHETREQLNDLGRRMEEAVTDVRRIAYDLRPPALDDFGLVEAVKQTATGYGRSGPEITVTVSHPLPPLSAAVEAAAYRIVQEALANAVRHGQPANCVVTLEADSPSVLLVAIKDNGVGISATATPGIGLRSMRERADELGGTLEIASAPGETVISARLPVRSTAEGDT